MPISIGDWGTNDDVFATRAPSRKSLESGQKDHEQGAAFFATDRGQPIAVITPLKQEDTLDATLKRMAAEGLITLPSRKGQLPRFEPIRIKGKPLSQTIIEDRDDRF